MTMMPDDALERAIEDLFCPGNCAKVSTCGSGTAASFRVHATVHQVLQRLRACPLDMVQTKRVVDALFDARLVTARKRNARIYPATG